jgi:hypothetical protein
MFSLLKSFLLNIKENRMVVSSKKTGKKMTAAQIKALDDIYQDSIGELEAEWKAASKKTDPDIVVDAIFEHYDERLCQAFKVSNMDSTLDKYTFGPRDWLYESAAGGIT